MSELGYGVRELPLRKPSHCATPARSTIAGAVPARANTSAELPRKIPSSEPTCSTAKPKARNCSASRSDSSKRSSILRSGRTASFQCRAPSGGGATGSSHSLGFAVSRRRATYGSTNAGYTHSPEQSRSVAPGGIGMPTPTASIRSSRMRTVARSSRCPGLGTTVAFVSAMRRTGFSRTPSLGAVPLSCARSSRLSSRTAAPHRHIRQPDHCTTSPQK